MSSQETENDARYEVTVALEGGYWETFEVIGDYAIGVDDDNNIVSYNFHTPAEERYALLYFKPSAIIGIKIVQLDEDESEESDSD